MTLRHLRWFAVLCAVLVSAGCDQGRQTQRNTTVRIANVAPSFAELNFRREQTNGTTLAFKGSTEASYGEDTYDFYVAARSLLSPELARTWTFAQDVRHGTIYTFVLTEDAGEVEPIILEYPLPTATSTGAQIVGLNAAGGFPPIDFYLEPAGVGIAGATPQATLAFQQPLTARTVPAGDYEITLTEAGNSSNVLLTSVPLGLGSTPSTFIITAESGEGTAALSVLLMQASPAVLYSTNATAELRVINGAADTVARDFAINREFSPPLFSAIPFSTPTSYATVPVASSQPVNVTPVGNPGVLEVDTLIGTAAAQRATALFAGNAGTLTLAAAPDDGRRIALEAKVRFMSAATDFSSSLIDFVIVRVGEDPTLALQVNTLSAPAISEFDSIPPGDYDLALRQNFTTTLLAGPMRITLAAGGIYSVLATNGASPTTANIVLLDDFVTP